MHVAAFFGPGLTRKHSDQGRLTMSEAIDGGHDIFQGFEVIHAVGAAAELAWSLRTAQEQNADDCNFPAVEVEDFLKTMLVLRDAAVGTAGGPGHALFLERTESIPNSVFVQRQNRFTIVLLITCVDQRVKRKRVVVGCGDVFLDQRAEDAGFDFGQDHWRSLVVRPWSL